MNKPTIDQRLSDSQPDHIKGNEIFVKRTMQAVGKAGAGETFEKVMRTNSVTKKETLIMKLRNLHKKLKQMPRYAAAFLILGTTGTAGAAAYAAYQWITPEVTITNIQQNNDDDKKQYTVDSQCGEYNSGKALQYEIAQDSGLTDEDAYKVFKNTCAYNALETFISSHWISDNGHEAFAKKKVGDIVTIYNSANLFAGSSESNQIFGLTIGKVTEISSSKVTFELTLYSVDNSAGFNAEDPSRLPFDYYPDGKVFSRTLALSPDVEVWEDGQMRKLADVKIGDTIQVVTRIQNKVQYYDDIKQNALGEQITFDTVGIIKVDIDTRYVASGIARIGDPKIVNGIAILSPCDNNIEHLCVSPLNQVIGPVYSAGDDSDQTNMKYLRKDILDKKKVKYHRLDGRVTRIEGKHITLETRGTKTSFTVDMPYDAVAEYNRSKPIMNDYDKSVALKLEIGDLVQVHYAQSEAENHLVVKPEDLQLFAILEQVQPDGAVTKY